MLVSEGLTLLMSSSVRLVKLESRLTFVGEVPSASNFARLGICRNGAKLLTPLSP